MILNGSVEVTHPDGRTEILCMGNSFGVSPTMEKEYMKGVMKTKVDDCQVSQPSRICQKNPIFCQKKEFHIVSDCIVSLCRENEAYFCIVTLHSDSILIAIQYFLH